MENFDDFIAVLKARKKSNEIDGKYKRVNIAVLDTGIRKDHRIVHKVVYHDFVEESNTNPQDLTGHGTNSVELILKACVDAELFVGRISGYNSSNETLGPTLMAKGIDWAREQKVDIISISAGFKRTRLGCPSPLRDAVDQAAKAGILIFAAASNWGNKDDIAYPAAIKDQVMCIFASNGANRHVRDFNPDPRNDADNFAILGENVKITEGDRDSGTSVATALTAGLAGRLIDFSRHTDSLEGIDNLNLIGTKAGMTAIFKRMSKGRKEGYDCIIPWNILEDSASNRFEQRAQARSEISLALRKAT
jgi:subtilisin family serine protease